MAKKKRKIQIFISRTPNPVQDGHFPLENVRNERANYSQIYIVRSASRNALPKLTGIVAQFRAAVERLQTVEGRYAPDSSLECGLRSERCKLACLHVGLGQKELAAMAVMAACNCAAANMRKAQPRQRYGLFALLGGKAMSSQKVSPNSAEIVAQLEAGRKGVKAKFCLRFRIASAVLTLLISAAIKLLG